MKTKLITLLVTLTLTGTAYAERIKFDAETGKSSIPVPAAQTAAKDAVAEKRAAIEADKAAGLDYVKWQEKAETLLKASRGTLFGGLTISPELAKKVTMRGEMAEDAGDVASAVWWYLVIANGRGNWATGPDGVTVDMSARAQYRLGMLYASGAGWPAAQAFVRATGATDSTGDTTAYAIKWLRIAEARGYAEAGPALQSVLARATPEQVAAGTQLTKDWRLAYVKAEPCGPGFCTNRDGLWTKTDAEKASDEADWKAKVAADRANSPPLGVSILKAFLGGTGFAKPDRY